MQTSGLGSGAEGIFESLSSAVHRLLVRVVIGLDREADSGVAKHFRRDPGRCSRLGERRGDTVTKVVQPNTIKASAPGEPKESAVVAQSSTGISHRVPRTASMSCMSSGAVGTFRSGGAAVGNCVARTGLEVTSCHRSAAVNTELTAARTCATVRGATPRAASHAVVAPHHVATRRHDGRR